MFVLDLSGIQNTILFEFKGWHTFHTNFVNLDVWAKSYIIFNIWLIFLMIWL